MKRLLAIALTSLLLLAFAALLGLGLSGVVSQYVFLVQVDGDSMEPTISDGDRVIVCGVCDVDEGDVMAFEDDSGQVVVHRAAFHVEYDERWTDSANPDLLPEHYRTCDALSECPADRYGWVTVGDNNDVYDQAGDDQLSIVAESDVEGRVVYVF